MKKQRWIEVSRTFTPPMQGRLKIESVYDESIILKAAYGFTTIKYEDSKGRRQPKFVTLIGDQT